MSIIKQSKLIIADNSGAVEIMCFHIIGSTYKTTAGIGDIVVATVKKANPGGQVKKSDKVFAVVVRTRLRTRRKDGTYISFSDNAAVIINGIKDNAPKGTRVFGPMARELKEKGYVKIVNLAEEVL